MLKTQSQTFLSLSEKTVSGIKQYENKKEAHKATSI
jgi:hypothetical protein